MTRAYPLAPILLALLALSSGCGTVSPLGVLPTDDDDDSSSPEGECDESLGWLSTEEGSFIQQGQLPVSATRPDCSEVVHATAGAIGSTLRVTLSDWASTGEARLEVFDLESNMVASASGLGTGDGVDFSLDRSGEWLIRLRPEDLQQSANEYSLDVTCEAGCEGRFTRYPVVFVHGMAGTDAYLGGYPYWYDVMPGLTDDGYLAFMPAVDALAPPETRAQQWSVILDGLQADGMGRRFNLLGHSQGGVDARYLATTMGEGGRIATITTLATPHYGSGLADVANGVIEVSPTISALIEEGVSALTTAIGLGEAQLLDATSSITRPAMEAFNEVTPDHPDVAYFSWTARTCGLVEFICQNSMSGEVVAPYLIATYRALQLLDGDNDGIVPTASGIWGEHLGTIGADHFDEVGQLAGQTDGNYDHRGFFLNECFRLSEAGF